MGRRRDAGEEEEDGTEPRACATGKLRLYVSGPLGPGPRSLAPDQAHWLGTVMRARPGTIVHLFNGRDGEWVGPLESVSRKGAVVRLDRAYRPQDSVPDLWLLFAPVKRGRVDWLVEKAVELGVARLLPVLTERTVVGRVNADRLGAHAIEAAEQCGRLSVPELAGPERLDRCLAGWDPARRLVFCDEHGAEGAAPPIARALSGLPPGPAAILIGPEGGFSPAERAGLAALPFALPVSLGPRIMRAETAALAALAVWQACLGDWRGGGPTQKRVAGGSPDPI
ncbi:MAG: 16S rRNA (uracil(1498)-N(3))-methyltransferase [Alphaproteobacteria bacterium]|nr:16S rRNA (uracil(1498)-N(3))-methyltransferase [Alphaproteobacteria bacterium]